jgi:hypothetical protein
MSEPFSKMEVITGVAGRRRFTTEYVNEALQPTGEGGIMLAGPALLARLIKRIEESEG